jgi:hypothetical protein
MPSTKALVYIPEIMESSWMLPSWRGDGTCLRTYHCDTPISDRNGNRIPREMRQYSLTEIRELLKAPDACYEAFPSCSLISYSDFDFWREQILLRNEELFSPETAEKRLLEVFIKDFNRASESRHRQKTVTAILDRWRQRFSSIKNKACFNHWDFDSPFTYYQKVRSRDFRSFKENTGIGWTSQLLEASRIASKVNYINTKRSDTDFSLIAMELSLGISSTNNPFRRGRTDYIKPDGLGLRKSGRFVVLEVKGPQDDPCLITPMLQAACGALAVVAKAAMLKKIAAQSIEDAVRPRLRPFLQAPRAERSPVPIALHVLTSTESNGKPRAQLDSSVKETCATILECFRNLDYIAYSFITPKQASNLGSGFSVDHFFSRDAAQDVK